MTRSVFCLTSAVALVASGALAEPVFNRVASFSTATQEGAPAETSAEIIAATPDGMTLVYTDSPAKALGRIDLTDPKAPKPLGMVMLDGEPTSVAILGETAFAGVNTSESYTAPSGYLAAIDIASGEEKTRCDLGGQPDSVAAKDGLIAVAIENERDEDAGDGRTGQMPAGYLVLVNSRENGLDCDSLRKVELTGLAEISPEDPEPEFVDINSKGEIVVTLQENNHLVVASPEGEVTAHFSAGAVDLDGIDTQEEGALHFVETVKAVSREPDAVKWLDDTHFITANEGDMDGGSRGWTVFAKDGTVVYESNASFEHALIQIGHYPEKRSGNKGVEPESVEVGIFDGTPLAFIGSERGSAVGVYDMTDPAAPVLKQILPSGIGPEGYVALPERNLLISANETDLREDGGPAAHVMVFERAEGQAAYPQITSEGMDELTGWGALSGLTAGEKPGQLFAVNDSFYAMQPTIFEIDATAHPAQITRAIRVTRSGHPAQKLDMEGITTDGKGGFWVSSEGRTDRVIPHAIYHITAEGEIDREIGLPDELMAVETRFSLEGITLAYDGALWIAVQREWRDDPKGLVKLLRFDPDAEDDAWTAVHYPLEKSDAGWVGLSEIVFHDGALYLIERDNQIGDAAKVKQITRVSLEGIQPTPLGGELPVVEKTIVRDLIPDLKSLAGFVVDKVEGLAFDSEGQGFVVTDNDGVDDSSGETLFFSIGNVNELTAQ